MSTEKATGLVVRATDYSETSRIVTVWTREFGKVRALAKGGRRLRSNFESALDLLSVCSIVFVRKTSGALDLLTEARGVERFPRLRHDLPALYAAYYVAELLGDWTEDYDPHPGLYEEILATLRALGSPGVPTGPRLLRFEMVLLRELGYAPILEACAVCRRPVAAEADVPEGRASRLTFDMNAGGIVCVDCATGRRGNVTISPMAWRLLTQLAGAGDSAATPEIWSELRRLMNQYICHLLGRRPRTMVYLGS
jgi:DNA repair protein RecO (recombination protein O)